MRRTLPPLPGSRFGVFTTAEAAAAGWTRSSLRHATARQHVVRLRRGVYVDVESWCADVGPELEQHRLVIRTIAAMLSVDTAVASHTSSAAVAGLPVWDTPDRPCLTVSPRYTGDSADAHLHRATFAAHQVVGDAVVPRLRTARTVLDIAREHGIEDAVVVGDCALGRTMATFAQLDAEIELCARWPGIRRAVDVLDRLDGRSESPLESVSRLRLTDHGVPEPDLQPDVFSRSGRHLGRLDFYWDEFGVAGEVDGRTKYLAGPVTALLAEKRRQALLEDVGILFVRWGRYDLEHMHHLVQRLHTVFARGARRPRSDRQYVIRPTAPVQRRFGARLDAG